MPEQPISPLAPNALRRVCTDEEVITQCTEKQVNRFDDLFVGLDQPRFQQALQLGLDESTKKHIFITGLSGPRVLDGIKTFVTHFLQDSKKKMSKPKDWCYIHNFDNPLEPIVIALNQRRQTTLPDGQVEFRGGGVGFKQRMERLLTKLQERIPAALVQDDIVAERQRINFAVSCWGETQRLRLIQQAKEEDVYVAFGEQGPLVGLIASHKSEIRDGKTVIPLLTPEEIESLTPREHEERLATQEKWIHRVTMASVEYDRRMRETEQAIIELNRQTVNRVVEELFTGIHLVSSQRAGSYIGKLKEYTIDNFGIFLPSAAQEAHHPHHKPFLPWAVNVLVDNSNQEIPPVVVDYEGTFESLVGSIKRIAGHGGSVYTDHTMIGAGSLARANNGYLILDAKNMLTNFGIQSYVMLKHVLSTGILQIQDIFSFLYGAGSIMPIEPMPIPLHVKVIMCGSHRLWSMLAHYDPDFFEHFEIKAEVALRVDWTTQEAGALASWTRRYAQTHELLPWHDHAVAKIVEQAARFADSQKYLSTDFSKLEPLIHEASYLAREQNAEQIDSSHICSAIERKFYRSNFRYEYMQRMIHDKKIILPLQGQEIGQITILSVMDFGDMRIGFPGRLACEWSAGKPGFVSIHREAKLAGNILAKGELTVQGYLEGMFAKRHPLALNISYTIEQTYDVIDGDSASMALLYSIISSLSAVPIRQDIAITGSLSQRGEPQPIGGVNEKIDGFFDACAMTGLTGTQGVIIPSSNARDLMLHERVIDAVEKHMFHIWAINTIAEGAQILMGKDAGKRNADFTFTKDSLYDLVSIQLTNTALNARRFFSTNDDAAFI